jgi:hypothetical protein
MLNTKQKLPIAKSILKVYMTSFNFTFMKKIFTFLALVATNFYCNAQTQYINDPSLELSGAGGTQWTDTDYYFTNAIVNNISNARTGNYSAYFESVTGNKNSSILSQYILATTTTYNNKLEFYIKCTASSGSSIDVFTVILDGSTQLFLTTGLKTDSALIGPNYKKIIINIDTLLQGIHQIDFASYSYAISSGRNVFNVDDITFSSGLPTSIIGECSSDCTFNISPTVTQNIININNKDGDKYTAFIYNLSGQLLQVNNLQKTNSSISIGHLPASYYLLVLKNDNGNILYKTKIKKQ